MGRQIYCIGYQGKSLDQIDQILEERGADLFDIRLKAWSRDPRFIGKSLSARYGNRYRHVPSLGNLAYQSRDRIEIADYAAGKAELDASSRAVLLMCLCRDPRGCHRTVVADMLRRDGYEVQELGDLSSPQAERHVGPVQLPLKGTETSETGVTLAVFGPPDKDAHETLSLNATTEASSPKSGQRAPTT